MKRLLCIIGSMDVGGAETFLMKIYRNLNREQYQMDFVVIVDDNFYEEEIRALGGKVFHVCAKRKNLLLYSKQLKEIIKQNKYDNVLRISAECWGTIDLWLAAFFGVKNRVLRSSNAGSERKGLNISLHNIFKTVFTSVATTKIAPSEYAAEFSFGRKAIQKGKIFYLHNGLDVNVYQYNEEKRLSVRNQYELQDKFVVGHVGRFSNQKNHKFIIEIFSELLKKREDSVLMLVGTGRLESDIKALVEELKINDKVMFMGVRKDIPDLLSAMDVMVFPSFFEGMPNTIVEAQACDLPCVMASTITPEANITGEVEILHLEDGAEVWADKVISACKKVRCDRSKEFIEKGYSIEKVTEQFCEIAFR